MPLRYEKTKICPYLRSGRCNKSAKCKYAHSQSELVPLPDLRKTRLCEDFMRGICKTAGCKFAHGLTELRCTEDVYKTSICLKFTYGHCPDGDSCRWAHGLSDLRPRHRAQRQGSQPDNSVKAGSDEVEETHVAAYIEEEDINGHVEEVAESDKYIQAGWDPFLIEASYY